LLGFVGIAQDDLGMPGEEGTRLGGLDPARMALEQDEPQFLLELPDVEAKGGLRDMNDLRRLGDRAMLEHGEIKAQAPEIHPILREHFRGTDAIDPDEEGPTAISWSASPGSGGALGHTVS